MLDQLSKIGKQIGGDLKGYALRSEQWKIGTKTTPATGFGVNFLTPASLVEEHDEQKEAVLQGTRNVARVSSQTADVNRRIMQSAGLEQRYYQEDFEPMLHELQPLPPNFDTEVLEEMALARTGVLEASFGLV